MASSTSSAHAPASSTSAASSSITHIAGLDGDVNRVHFENGSAKFKTLRVTIHITGAWPKPSPHSDNHVTILLILISGGAIQIDMRIDANDRRGRLVWKRVDYQNSSSAIKSFDFDLDAAVQVKTLYKAMRFDWRSHQYRFSAGGSGCHYWAYV